MKPNEQTQDLEQQQSGADTQVGGAEETIDGAAGDETLDGAEGEDTAESAAGEDTAEGAEGDTVITIGDEEPPAPEPVAPHWVKELRREHRDLKRRNRELEQQLQGTGKPEPGAPAPVGAKPKLEEFDYDAEQYETALAAWFERKREADERARAAQKTDDDAKAAWGKQVELYGQQRDNLRMSDYDDVEAVVTERLSTVQQGIILQGAENAALVMYAIGKNPARLAELAAIRDPVKFAFAIARLEKDVKVGKRASTAPPPERTVSGTAPKSGSVDSNLERLRAEAERTGDYTKVHQYRQSKRQTA